MNLLVIDDDKAVCFALEELFKNENFKVQSANNAEDGLGYIKDGHIDIAVIDYQLPGMNGMELLKKIKDEYSWIQVIMITGFGSEKIAIEAIKNGAYDFVSKPFNNEELVNRVNHIRNTIKIQAKTDDGLGFYFSPGMKNIIETVKTVAKIDTPLLITGDSGTGKELIAKMAHKYSDRTGKFIPVNCSAIPESLIESEFFGSEKGAYTGSISNKKGFFELAENGTIFLDEIGEMPLEMQVKILRVLQEGEITKVGGGIPQKVNARIIAATNRDLESEVAEKKFREDLYYRLNVVRIQTKSLSERKDEIKPLSEIFLKEFNLKYQKNISGFEASLMAKMCSYKWNGNIRELKNKIENAVIFCKDDLITDSYLTIVDIDLAHSQENVGNYNFNELPDNITAAKRIISERFEEVFINHYLNKHNGNVRNTALQIGLSRQDLYKKIKIFGLKG